jgi:hypothetical protein
VGEEDPLQKLLSEELMNEITVVSIAIFYPVGGSSSYKSVSVTVSVLTGYLRGLVFEKSL